MFTKNNTKILKGVAIILMLYHHLFAFPNRILINRTIKYIPLINFGIFNSAYILGMFGKICVSIFIFLSGYGLYESFKTKKCYYNTILNKIKNLYIKYWKIFFVVIPISIILKTDGIVINVKELFNNLTAFKISYCGEWGFISFYVILLLLFPILKKIIDKYNFKLITYFTLITLLNVVVFVIRSDWIINFYSSIIKDNYQAFEYLPTFLMGIISSKFNILNYIKNIKDRLYIYNILCIFLMLFIIYMRILFGIVIDFVLTFVFILIITYLLNNENSLINKTLIKLGNESMNIWLIHSFFCYKWCQEFIYYPRFSILI